MAKSRKKTSGSGWALVEPCPRCGQLPGQCLCDDDELDGGGTVKIAKLRMEKRKGKPTTVLYDLSGVQDMKALSRTLKNLVSAGGTVKDGTIELQGEHRDRIRAYLKSEGFQVKG
ncbi:MAG: translation initiation factor [Candidatus Marinimicrobia bacterium]|nr:translation initiation factor [Candidatus Neomarinimicrobiota bacterium]MCF7839242.1 translation initiation factor [Candidatus Neomarinimicrobiota bacterium]